MTRLRYHKVIIMTDADVDGLPYQDTPAHVFLPSDEELIERGHLYIAQPPLFRVADKKREIYIHNEEEMRNFILENGVERIHLVTESGAVFTGGRLLAMIRKIMRIQSIGERFEKDGVDDDVIRLLAADPLFSSGSFRSQESLREIGDRLCARLGEDGCDISFVGDPEQEENALGLRIFRPGRKNAILLQPEIVKSAKFIELRSLLSQVTALGEPPFRLSPEGEEAGTVELPSLDSLVENVMATGKKGFAVQRYKGLGEMNPEQLWSTTMNPEKRTLLQVRVDDAVVADEIFTTLMGDQVEPRREFIYRNALYASNLDV